MIKKKTKVKRLHYIDGTTSITNKKYKNKKDELNPEAGVVELLGATIPGFRVRWNYSKDTALGAVGIVVEELNSSGNWITVSGIQKLTIEFNANKYIPVIKMEKIII